MDNVVLDAKRILIAIFWILAIAIPIISTLITISLLPQGVDIPLHWNAQGQVDRFGSPWEMFPGCLIMSACAFLLAIGYASSNRLYDLGLVHGVSRQSTRPVLCGTAVFLILVWLGILLFWIQQVNQTMF